jgi:hypothetical protein
MMHSLFNVYCKRCSPLTESISKTLIRIAYPWNYNEERKKEIVMRPFRN